MGIYSSISLHYEPQAKSSYFEFLTPQASLALKYYFAQSNSSNLFPLNMSRTPHSYWDGPHLNDFSFEPIAPSIPLAPDFVWRASPELNTIPNDVTTAYLQPRTWANPFEMQDSIGAMSSDVPYSQRQSSTRVSVSQISQGSTGRSGERLKTRTRQNQNKW